MADDFLCLKKGFYWDLGKDNASKKLQVFIFKRKVLYKAYFFITNSIKRI